MKVDGPEELKEMGYEKQHSMTENLDCWEREDGEYVIYDHTENIVVVHEKE